MTVPYCHVALLTRFAEGRGVQMDALLDRFGLRRDGFDQPDARVSAEHYTGLLRAVACFAPIGDTWLAFGAEMTLATIGPLGQLLATCQSARQALPILCQYYTLVGCGTQLRLEQDWDAFVFPEQLAPIPATEQRLKLEILAAAFGRNAAILTDSDRPFMNFEMPFPKPDDEAVARYRKHLGPGVSFGHRRARFSVPGEQLDLPFRSANASMKELLLPLCDAKLTAERAELGIDGLVRSAVLATPGMAPTLAGTARQLGLSSRTLSRRLSELGVTFDRVRKEARHERARQLLSSTELSVSEVASDLGFDCASNFTRAFLRWSGSAPSDFRARLKSRGIAWHSGACPD